MSVWHYATPTRPSSQCKCVIAGFAFLSSSKSLAIPTFNPHFIHIVDFLFLFLFPFCDWFKSCLTFYIVYIVCYKSAAHEFYWAYQAGADKSSCKLPDCQGAHFVYIWICIPCIYPIQYALCMYARLSYAQGQLLCRLWWWLRWRH